MAMPKYYRNKIADHYLYFKSQCIVEAMHVHASDKHLTEKDSAKFFVRADGSAVKITFVFMQEQDLPVVLLQMIMNQ